jgi:uncharacterized protein YaiI (UPF0178 family)
MVRNVVVSRVPTHDDWIVDNARSNDTVETADIPLAPAPWRLAPTCSARLTPIHADHRHGGGDARPSSICETGESKGYNASFAPQDRSRFPANSIASCGAP